jgi:hypothetical protein
MRIRHRDLRVKENSDPHMLVVVQVKLAELGIAVVVNQREA